MDYSSSDNLFSKKNIITYLILAIIVLAIPVAVKLVQNQQILRSQAALQPPITFPDLKREQQGIPITTSPNIKVQLISPFGPPASQTQTQ